MNQYENIGMTPTDEQSALECKARVDVEEARSRLREVPEEEREDYLEYIEFLESQVEYTRARYHKERASDELQHHLVHWDHITIQDVRSLQELLEQETDEPTMHRFLQDNPKLLIQALAGGNGRYLISKQRLGSEHVPDFMIAEEHSMGLEWHSVELESPLVKPHRKDGLQSQKLTHAIGQISDWRRWLMDNLDYARRPPKQNGLGLIGIDNRVSGLIVIGRRTEPCERYNEFRRQMIDRERIRIHNYDWLLDVARSNRSGSLSRDPRNY